MLLSDALKKYEKLLKLITKQIGTEFSTNEIKKFLFLIDYKYNSYQHFPEGLNFLENFYLWLKNFTCIEDIDVAIDLLWKITFYSQNEIQYLLKLLYREKIRRFLLSKIINDQKLSNYDYKTAYNKYWSDYISKSIFIALSDGALIDYFRRVNDLNNERVVAYYKLHPKAQKEKKEFVKYFFLIDDFVGTGTTFLRDESEDNTKYWLDEKNIFDSSKTDLPDKNSELSGALIRFIDYWNLNENNEIIFCPYIITEFAKCRLEKMIKYYGQIGKIENFKNIQIIPAYTFPNESRVIEKCSSYSEIRKWDQDKCNFKGISKLCEDYYYLFKETSHHKKGGGCKHGFGDRGFAIVRYNNTPNNSLYLIWHNHNGWHPLFLRNERHKD